jgi:hypothetical protein
MFLNVYYFLAKSLFFQKKLKKYVDMLRVFPHNMHHHDKSSLRMHGQYLPVAQRRRRIPPPHQ